MIYPRISLYALMLAAAGIPLYIHLPQFAASNLGIDLATIGLILLGIRLFDLIQDPLIGWMIDHWPNAQAGFSLIAAFGLAVFFPLLFGLTPGASVEIKLVLILMGLFSAYSLGSILLYGRSATLALRPDAAELLRVAGFREAGMLAGVILAAIAPGVFVAFGFSGQGYGAFGVVLGIVAFAAAIICLPMWKRPVIAAKSLSLSGLRNAGAVRLLIIAVLNALPVALTSTLFLFFVQDRLGLPEQAGMLLALFFLCAGVSVPVWTAASRRIGAKNTLLFAMPLAIICFAGAALLSPGNLFGFAVICAASGAALGADMVLLPALFSISLTRAGLNASTGFGIWSFAGKSALALAAALGLQYLETREFVPGGPNTAEALFALTLAYAVIPCVLKIAAFAAVLTLPSERSMP